MRNVSESSAPKFSVKKSMNFRWDFLSKIMCWRIRSTFRVQLSIIYLNSMLSLELSWLISADILSRDCWCGLFWFCRTREKCGNLNSLTQPQISHQHINKISPSDFKSKHNISLWKKLISLEKITLQPQFEWQKCSDVIESRQIIAQNQSFIENRRIWVVVGQRNYLVARIRLFRVFFFS